MSLNLPFTTQSTKVFSKANELAEEAKNTQITPTHFALALCDTDTTDGFTGRLLTKAGGELARLVTALKAKLSTLPKQDPPPDHISPDSALVKVLKAADALRKKNEDTHIAIDHLIQASLTDAGVSKAFGDAGVNTNALTEAIKETRGSRKVTSEGAEGTFEALKKYGVDLVERAEAGKIDPVIGRDDEIRRVIRVLSRRTKNNPALVGRPAWARRPSWRGWRSAS